MRQSIQERRIAVQLMQLRREKDFIRRNRLAKEKQFEEARVREFEEALNKEKVRHFSRVCGLERFVKNVAVSPRDYNCLR